MRGERLVVRVLAEHWCRQKGAIVLALQLQPSRRHLSLLRLDGGQVLSQSQVLVGVFGLGLGAVVLQKLVLASRMLGQGGLAAEALFAAINGAPIRALSSVNATVARQA